MHLQNIIHILTLPFFPYIFIDLFVIVLEVQKMGWFIVL